MVLNYNRQTSELTLQHDTRSESPPCSILIVDDDPISRLLLQRCLLRFNPQLQIDMAASGETALHLVQEKRCHVVFLDLFLPDTGGLELQPRLRQVMDGSPIALIGHTVQLHRSTELLQAGFTAFLPKPFTRRELQQVIQQIAPTVHCCLHSDLDSIEL